MAYGTWQRQWGIYCTPLINYGSRKKKWHKTFQIKGLALTCKQSASVGDERVNNEND